MCIKCSELTYENVAGIIGGDGRPYGITLLETIEDGILLAADEYGALRGIQYNEAASELALEKIHGTAVVLTMEQVVKIRGED